MNQRSIKNLIAAIYPCRAVTSAWLVLGMLAGHHHASGGEPYPVLLMLVYFIVFQILYGAIYLINDLIDYPLDIRHPIKSKRIVASAPSRGRPRWSTRAY